MQVLALYDLESADNSLGIDMGKSIAKRHADKERLRGEILGYAS
jgi:hypothetical protein